MPKFMDFHPNLILTLDMIRNLAEETKVGRHDQFKVRQLELFYSADGKVY